MPRLIAVVCCCLMTLMLSSCPGSEGTIIHGLQLPADATIVRRTDELSQYQFDRLPLAYGRLCTQGQQIFFSSAQDWATVSGQIDQQMQALGYHNKEDLYYAANKLHIQADFPRADKPEEFIRCYWEDNKEFAVMLLNFQHLDGREYLSFIDGAPSNPTAQYGLYLGILQPGVSSDPLAKFRGH